ncbi:MAG: hypothetical protein HY836_06620 [Aquabacterium sp.]|uniref:hypothetical protein n=1 Tax=Aquabacterium sp. TaxID=1872578 RepID=UPI0025C0B80A|nr:hypothetical protein [Aquabacterium sp.]MBI5925256.1 hypothetical protein [Aquabacterium sp.]
MNITFTFARAAVALVGALSAASFAPSVMAGAAPCGSGCSAPVASGSGEADTTQAYAGINWAFGSGPELVLGVRSLHTNDRNKVAGAKVEATFPFGKQSISFDKLRLRLVGGNRAGMYELGAGYSFGSKGFLLSGALQADYVVAGTDFNLSNFQWQPFVGVNTLARPDEGQGGGLSCPAGWTMQDANTVETSLNVTVDPSQEVNGKTCVNNT